jgi:ABC-type Na+ efflux pump permease subunit
MDRSVGYAVGGVMALIIFFALTPTVASQLDNAQNDFTPFSNTTELNDIVTTQTNVLIENDTVTVDDASLASEYSATVGESDQVEVTISEVQGEITVNGETENESGTYRVDGDSVTVETSGSGDTYTLDSVTGVEERENAAIMALVFIIFTVAFVSALYRAAM